MKKWALLLLSLFVMAGASFFCACGGNNGGNNGDGTNTGNTDDKGDPSLSNFTGITFADRTLDYDGEEHEIVISGTVPEGASVVYTDNKGTDAGVYNASVKISKEGYNTLNLSAKLTINKLSFTGITFTDKTLDYDGEEHSVVIAGTVPDGASVVYTANKGTNAGVYNATVKISMANYNDLTLSAKLTINKLSFTGITFTDKTVDYNGEEHSVVIAGTVPEGASVVYTANKGTNAGVYNASVKISKANYNDLTLNAVLTIEKIEYEAASQITLSNLNVEYDARPHSIQVVGNVPTGAQINYTYNGADVASVTAPGTYTVVCTIESPNYLTITRTATLKITSTEEQLYSANSGGTLYFQNNLDKNKLYAVTSTGVKKVNNDVPEYMVSDGTSLYYYSTSLFSKVIKSYDGTKSSNLYSASGEYLVTDGTYVYYAVNNLIFNTSLNGIYKYPLAGNQEEATRLTTDKAEYLVHYGNYIYYSNKTDGGKLYRISVNANEGTGTKVWDEKVSYIINDGSTLYFDSSNGLARAIYKYNVSTSGNPVKLTTDSGKYLTKVGNYIYYINNDLLTSNIFGDGIYRVSVNANSSLPGEKVISADNNGYSSLSSDGTYLYFYKLNDKHFYRYNVTTKTETDLMANFVPAEVPVTATGYSSLAEYNGEIYYTNPLDDGSLYKYSPATGNNFKVLADSVSNVYFYNGYMYYSTYILTNYALFRMDLATGEITKINKSRCENLIFDGDTIYYVDAGFTTKYLMKMNLDGGNVTELYTGKSLHIKGFEKVGDDIYFVINPAVGYKYIYKYSITAGTDDAENLNIKAQDMVIYDGKIYYYDSTGNNALKVCNLDGTGETEIKTDLDVNAMYAHNGVIYFSSNSTKNTGFYAYDIASGEVNRISTKQANGIVAYDGKIYFLQSDVSYVKDYPAQATGLDCRLYCYDGTKVTKVA